MTLTAHEAISQWDGRPVVYLALMEKLTDDLMSGVEPPNAGWLDCGQLLEPIIPNFTEAITWVHALRDSGQIQVMPEPLGHRPRMKLSAAGVVLGAQAVASEGTVVFEADDLASVTNSVVSDDGATMPFRPPEPGEVGEVDVHAATDVAGFLNSHMIAWSKLVRTPDNHYAIPAPESEAAQAFLMERLADAGLLVREDLIEMRDLGLMIAFVVDPRLIRFTAHESRRLSKFGHELAQRLTDMPGLPYEVRAIVDLFMAVYASPDPLVADADETTLVDLLSYYRDAALRDDDNGKPFEEQGWRLAQPDMARGALAVETLMDGGWLESRPTLAHPSEDEYRITAEGMTLTFLLSSKPTHAG